jgi:Flp pilus assembly protein TadG
VSRPVLSRVRDIEDQRRHDRGTAAIELTLLVPALMVMLGLLVGGGRLWLARTTVTEAAQTAARSGSLARTASQASRDGASAGADTLSTRGLVCLNQTVSVDARAFAVPVGSPATVTSHVSCSVPFRDVFLPGMPGTIRIRATGASALDTYRSRR